LAAGIAQWAVGGADADERGLGGALSERDGSEWLCATQLGRRETLRPPKPEAALH
jgi:hypothetical protein